MALKPHFLSIAIALLASILLTNSVEAAAKPGPWIIVANPNSPLDAQGQNLNISDPNSGITATRVDSSKRTTRWYTFANWANPSAGATASSVLDFTLDTKHNKIYWIDEYGISVGKIGGCTSASNCGQQLYSNAELGTETGDKNLSGLGIDTAHGRLFVGVWDQSANYFTIKQVGMSRNVASIRELTSAGHIPDGSGIGSIVYFQDKIYWTQATSWGLHSGLMYASTIDESYGVIAGGPDEGAFVNEIWGLAIDRDTRKVYWANWTGPDSGVGSIGAALLDLPNSANLYITTSNCWSNSNIFLSGPSGVAYDFHTKRVTWGNWNYTQSGNPGSARVDRANKSCQLVETNQSSIPAGDTPYSYGQTGAVAYLYQPELKKAAKVTFKTKTHALLSCDATFADDRAEARLFMAPSSLTYKWAYNGAKVAGSNSKLRAKKSGNYSCSITAKNFAGSISTSSARVFVSAQQAK